MNFLKIEHHKKRESMGHGREIPKAQAENSVAANEMGAVEEDPWPAGTESTPPTDQILIEENEPVQEVFD
ncbi:MAG: hypothetical protein N2B58_03710 [Desulfobacterales bacterium]|jgi:hypothetical protein